MFICNEIQAVGTDGLVAVDKPRVGTCGIRFTTDRDPRAVGTADGTENKAANTGTPLAKWELMKLTAGSLSAMAGQKWHPKTQSYQQAWAGAAHQQRRQAAGWRRQ